MVRNLRIASSTVPLLPTPPSSVHVDEPVHVTPVTNDRGVAPCGTSRGSEGVMKWRTRSSRVQSVLVAAILVVAFVLAAPLAASAVAPSFITKWGTNGGGDGQFREAHNVAVDADGYVYVCDLDNNRIQKFTSEGVFVTKWGSSGSSDGRFNEPRGISVDADGNVWVVDDGNNRVQKFSNTGTFLMKFGVSGSTNGRFSSPHSITFDSDGNVYVSDRSNNRIQKFTSAGVYVSQFGNSGATTSRVSGPKDVVFDGVDKIIVADAGKYRISVYTTAGVYVGSFGSNGTGEGQFKDAHGISVGSNGDVYVSDGTNNNVQVFSADGEFKFKWGTTGTGNSQFRSPTGLWVTPDDTVYVADADNHRVQVFAIDGTPPVTTCDAPDSWQNSDVEVTLAATDSQSDIDKTYYRINGGGWVEYAGPFTVSDEGETTIDYYSVDVAGNTETEKIATVKIDKTAPATTNDAPSGWKKTPFVVKLEATDALSGVATTEYSLDGVSWLPYTDGIDVATDGEWVIYFRSVDEAGNVEDTSSVTVRLDTKPPAVGVTGVGNSGVYTGPTIPKVTCGDPTATLVITLNGKPYVPGTPVSAVGSYTLRIQATDPAGNVTVVEVKFQIIAAPVVQRVNVMRVGAASSAAAAVRFSADAWKQSNYVIIARIDDYADSVSAAGLAGQYRAPVLLTSTYRLDAATKKEIKRLGAKKVFIVGGTQAITPKVATSLKKMGLKVERLGGANRYETSVLVGKRIKKAAGSKFSRTVIVGSGSDWRSTLGVASLAYQLKAPVVWVQKTSCRPSAKKFLAAGKFKTMLVVGSTGSVSAKVSGALAKAGKAKAKRISGANRYEVAARLASLAVGYDGKRTATVGLIDGNAWQYAATAGPAVAKAGGVVLVTGTKTLGSAPKKFITAHKDEVRTVKLMGNGSTPSKAVGDQARGALK